MAIGGWPSWFLRVNLALTDVGFLFYWLVSLLSLLPTEWLYKDADNPLLLAWNWSFAPIDIAASISGLLALRLVTLRSQAWRSLALISITLTFCAGLMAVSFWALRGDFSIWWWLPNAYLIFWPLATLNELFRQPPGA